MVEGLDLRTRPNELDFGTHSPDWSKEYSSNQPYPQSHPKPQCVSASPVAQIHPVALFWLLKCRFSDLDFLSVGRKSATFLCKSFRKVSSNKNIGFSNLGVGFDLGCPFYRSSFPVFNVGVLHICGDFHRHVLCSDRHVLWDLKHRCSASVSLGLSKERFLWCRTISLELLNQIIIVAVLSECGSRKQPHDGWEGIDAAELGGVLTTLVWCLILWVWVCPSISHGKARSLF